MKFESLFRTGVSAVLPRLVDAHEQVSRRCFLELHVVALMRHLARREHVRPVQFLSFLNQLKSEGA